MPKTAIQIIASIGMMAASRWPSHIALADPSGSPRHVEVSTYTHSDHRLPPLSQ